MTSRARVNFSAVLARPEEIVTPRYRGDDFELDRAVDGLFDAYANLAGGIHNDVQAAASGMGMMPRVESKPPENVANRMIFHPTKLFVGETEPDYARDYKAVRDEVFNVLFLKSLQKKDYSFLLATIKRIKDPVMARRLLEKTMNLDELRVYRVIGAQATSHALAMKPMVYGIKKTVSAYARHQRNLQWKKELYKDKTSLPKACALGLVSLTGFRIKRYIKQEFYLPLTQISKMHPIEKQLLLIEEKGLPKSDYAD